VTFVRNPVVEWLLHHSYGQGGTVAIPVAQNATAQTMPRGHFPPGVGDVIDHLTERYAAWSNTVQEVDWCFLVGGPGNGKSEALRELASSLGIALPSHVPGQPVPRTIPKNWPSTIQALASGLGVVLVNDASIPRPTIGGNNSAGSLFQDIHDALDRISSGSTPVAVFGNVNRGILVEEANILPHFGPEEENEQLAASIVRWLASPPATQAAVQQFPKIKTVVVPKPEAPQYGQFTVVVPGPVTRSVIVHAVFLDVLSLLEPTPGRGSAVIDFAQSPAAVAQYQTFGNLLSMDIPRDETTGGDFLRSFASSERWEHNGCKDSATDKLCEAYQTCPFAQNSRWIQTDSLRRRCSTHCEQRKSLLVVGSHTVIYSGIFLSRS
jgi:hypothetical protein